MAGQNALNEGISLYNHGKFSAALSFFLSLPEDDNIDDVELAYYIGLCYAKLKRYDDALLYLEQVVTASGDSTSSRKNAEADRLLQCRYLLAVIYCLSGRKKLAEFELGKLLEIGYRPSSVYASLAYIAWEQNNPDQSLAYYSSALEADSNNPTALNGMGYVLAEQNKDLTQALSYCKKALDREPESAACLDSLGWVYFKMGLYAESRKYLEKALERDASNHTIAEHLSLAQRVEE